MKTTFTILLLASAMGLYGQTTNDFLVAASMDVVKTDIDKVFGKAQAGLEVNYFIQPWISATAGAELWTKTFNSFVLGVRFYPKENLFIRFRVLTGATDAVLGVGYSQPIARGFRAEVMGDLYMSRPDFALRGGIAYVINYVKKPIRTGN